MRRSKHVARISLGEVVAGAYELGGRVGGDDATVAQLATRRLERALICAGNLRLQAALLELARELSPWTAQEPFATRRVAAVAR